MKKIILAVCLLVCFIAKSQNLSKIYQHINSSVVVINIINVSRESAGEYIEVVTEESQGSGVLIGEEGLIWTAAHDVLSAEADQIEFLDVDIY